MYKNFVDDCLNVEAFLTDLDKYIDYWHKHDTGSTLREFLGLTTYEYSQWGKTGDNNIFRDILRCRIDGIDFKKYESMLPEKKIAARSYDIDAIEKLRNNNKNE